VATPTQSRKVVQTWSFRGSKSRNKVLLSNSPSVAELNGDLAPERGEATINKSQCKSAPLATQSNCGDALKLSGTNPPDAGGGGQCPRSEPTEMYNKQSAAVRLDRPQTKWLWGAPAP
jgi:hypothetical protein